MDYTKSLSLPSGEKDTFHQYSSPATLVRKVSAGPEAST